MLNVFDLCVIGSGPGGYVAAIRASQLGLKTAVIEKKALGGVCLNTGCIPTKALLESAKMYQNLKKVSSYGLKTNGIEALFPDIITRSRTVANKMSMGVQFLMKKNGITVFYGQAKITSPNEVGIYDQHENLKETISASHIIIATGASPKSLPHISIDGKYIIDSEQAMTLKKQPKHLLIMGAGAIGVEFAYFYHTLGTKVSIVELQPSLLPLEDKDVGNELTKIYRKQGMSVYVNSIVDSVIPKNKVVEVSIRKGEHVEKLEADIVLSSVGVVGNISNLGLEHMGIKTHGNMIVTDKLTYQTSVPNIYAIGDVAGPPWLAHKASHEGVLCVERITGLTPPPLQYDNIPGCTYCEPQVASVGLTESQAKDKGYDIKIGIFPFKASGKAQAVGYNEGFVKVIFDNKYGEWLGCHMIGSGVTEMISEAVVARSLETTGIEIIHSVHPHPTMSEAIMEAVAEAYGEGIHLGTVVKK